MKRHKLLKVGQTIALRGLSSLADTRLHDRRQKAIVCPTRRPTPDAP